MPASTADPAEYVLAILRKKGREDPQALVGSLLERFPQLGEERAGEIIWMLLDAHKLRLTEEAELEASDAPQA